MVEGYYLVHEHKIHIRTTYIVLRRVRQIFGKPYYIVGEMSDRSAAERGNTFYDRRGILFNVFSEYLYRITALFDRIAVKIFDIRLVFITLKSEKRIPADKGISVSLLAALYGL